MAWRERRVKAEGGHREKGCKFWAQVTVLRLKVWVERKKTFYDYWTRGMKLWHNNDMDWKKLRPRERLLVMFFNERLRGILKIQTRTSKYNFKNPLSNFTKDSQGSNSTRHVIFISPSLLFNSPLFFPENKLSATMECFEFKKHRKIMKHFACVQQQNLKVLSCWTNLFLRTMIGARLDQQSFFLMKRCRWIIIVNVYF